MLTFEITQDGDVLEIHADQAGLSSLIRRLDQLRSHQGHLHLMTPAWGGEELSEGRQGSENRLLNHVKVMLWK
jgi:hypothetical protein